MFDMLTNGAFYVVIVAIIVIFLYSGIRVLREYERAVMFTLGRFSGVRGPGLILMIAVVYFRVVDPDKAVIQVADYFGATSQLAQTTLRSVLGKHELDEMLAERDKLNHDIQHILDAQTDAWGIKVANVEIKHVDIDE